MSDRIEGIAFSIEGLRRDADEIEACGGGNEAATMRWAAARIAELEAALRWQPIATAPKDGSTIVAVGCPPVRAGYSIIFWDTFNEEWAGYTAEDEKRLVKFPPLHWMPLPEPPTAE